MNLKKVCALTSLIVTSLVSTAAHADAKKYPGWHYVEVINNVNAKSIMFYTGREIVCLPVRSGQIVKTKTLVKNNTVFKYEAYASGNCSGAFKRQNFNLTHADKDEYWHLWF